MRQFMCKQLRPGPASRREKAAGKDQMIVYRVSPCIHLFGRSRGLGVCMHAHFAEVISETWLHESARRSIQRLAGRA
jgi:hypothetical protein